MNILIEGLQGGLAGLFSYLAAHVLLCLVPAFSLPGRCRHWCHSNRSSASSGRMPRNGCRTRPLPGLVACLPFVPAPFSHCLQVSTKGCWLGAGGHFPVFAPAANILALSYTGVALGADFAIARIVLALTFGVGIGMIMAIIFRRGEEARLAGSEVFSGGEAISRKALLFLATLVALLLAGTLKLEFLEQCCSAASCHGQAPAPFSRHSIVWFPSMRQRGLRGSVCRACS